MKFSTIMTIAAAALTLTMTGCKYDKSKKGAGAGDGAGASDITTGTGTDLDSQTGSLSDAMGAKFEDMYARCTDVDFSPVYFAFDSSVVPQGELPKIDAVAQHLQSKPERVVVIEGHCDERGSNEYNMSLGENRAQIIKNYLVQNGIADSRIQTRSYGAEKPAAEGHDESAWAQNRRGEFGIYDTTQRKQSAD